MGVGFDSGLSGFAFTCIILLFWLLPPITYPGKARKLAAQALKKKADWSILDSKKVGAFIQQSVWACETGPSKKYQLAQTRTLCCFVQEWPSGHSPGGCAEGLANLICGGYGQHFLQTLSSFYPGYHATHSIGQVVIVTLYAMADGLIGGAVFGWLYNRLAA